MVRYSKPLFFLLTATLALPAFGACLPTTQAYELEAQRLDSALQQFAHTSGCFVRVDTAELGDLEADGLSGRYTPGNALIRLVRGSGFEVHPDPEGYAVNRADREGLRARIERLEAEIDTARRDERIAAPTAKALHRQLEDVWLSGQSLIDSQGFLSAAENASFERVFAYVRGRLAPAKAG